jgi:hypothetical protein
MRTMLMLPAVAVGLSLGIGLAYAGDGDGQSVRPPFTSAQDQSHSVSDGAPPTRPLFTIGRVEVRAWAPVAPPHNTEANEDPTARTIWGAGEIKNCRISDAAIGCRM